MTFQLGKQPAFLATYDWRFTEGANTTFQNKCYQALVDAQVKGKGYFMESHPEVLQDKLKQAMHNGNYVAVANYAMMLHTQQVVLKEKTEWANSEEPLPEDDDLPFR